MVSKALKSLLSVLFLFLFITCNNDEKKELKEWKKRVGTYTCSESYVLHTSDMWRLEFDQMHVHDSGISLLSRSHTTMPSINFDVLHKKNNDNGNYQYKLRYSSLLSMQINPQTGEVSNPQIDRDLFVAGRNFYLSFEGNSLTFTIIDKGKIEQVLMSKI